MSKRRIDPGRAKEIAAERMGILMRLAASEASAGDIGLARRHVSIAVRIGMKTQTPMPRDIRYCKNCGVPLVPAVCSVRLRNHKITMRCLECGHFRRIPYIREQR
jgi:ribonuclease P protein subunit RPR2